MADGEVSALSLILGYGNLLILKHYNDYRTVYAHLSDIAVAESQAVKEGQVIAKSGDSLEESILHFEIGRTATNRTPNGGWRSSGKVRCWEIF